VSSIIPHKPATGLATRLRGVAKAYGPLQVLKPLDLHIEAGEFVAIVGRSGCGKSTLLRLMAGLEAPSLGEIRHDGQIRQKSAGDIRVMFQEARLLPWRSLLENVAIGLKGDSRPLACAALREVGLQGREQDWPMVLSGGQKQRVALARALVSRPRLLLLDEPLGALDALTRIEMQNLIESLWLAQGFSAVLVTHDVAEAVALADRVILLEDGGIGLDIPVNLPRPRERGAAEFARLEGEVLRRVLRKTNLSS
jgi:sulfonate transport system ATP-binding protein